MIISTKRIQSHKRTGSANTRSRQKTLITFENFLITTSLLPNTIVNLSKDRVWYVWKYDFKLARPLRYPRSAFLGCDGGNEALMTSGACKSVIACAKSTILTRTSGEYFIPLSSSKESISSCVAPSYKNSNDVAYNRYCGIVLTIASATHTLELTF